MRAVQSYVSLGLIELSGPLRATVVLTAYTDLSVGFYLDDNISRGVLAVVGNNYASIACAGNATAVHKFKLDSHRRYLIGHLIVGVLLEVTHVSGAAGCSAHTT